MACLAMAEMTAETIYEDMQMWCIETMPADCLKFTLAIPIALNVIINMKTWILIQKSMHV
jgi:hypothetical protein